MMARFSVVVGVISILFIVCVAPQTREPQIQTTFVGENTSENSLTFDWYDSVSPEKVNISTSDRVANPRTHLAEKIKLYKDVNGTFKVGATNFAIEFPDSISWTKTAGFVDTVFYGYQQHHNVKILSDDIWTAIIVQFSLYVNANAEKLRHSFVNFEEKKKLTVKFRSRIDRVQIPVLIEKVLELIEENIDSSVYDWILPKFSTTTANDKITVGVAMMATLREYFDYEFYGIICLIPKATILGTVDDWVEIKERLKRLNDFELDGQSVMAQWSYMLDIILTEFVNVKKGNPPDEKFWKEAIRIDYKFHDFVCAKINESSLNGWLTTFSAFNLNGKWRGDDTVEFKLPESKWPWLRIRTDKITPGVIQVPIKIHDEYAREGERDYNGAIIAGHMGYSVKEDEMTLQPFTGWIMTITNSVPRYLRNTLKSG